MSDLDDLELEPEDLHLEEEELAAPSGKSAGNTFAPQGGDKGPLLKVVGIVVIFVLAGGYFIFSRPSAPRPVSTAASMSAASSQPPAGVAAGEPAPANNNAAPLPAAAPDNTATTGTNSDPLAWNGAASAPSAPAPNALAAPAPMPAAIPAPGSPASPATPAPAVPEGQAVAQAQQNATPPVGEMPAAIAAPAMPLAGPAVEAAPVKPADNASAASMMPAPMPVPADGALAPAEKTMPIEGAPAQLQPVMAAPEIKGDKNMPAAAVPGVDKVEVGTAQPAAPQPVKTPEQPSVPAEKLPATAGTPEDSAKVAELQKKIDELEKTITQLQATAVTKEETSAKPAEAGATETASAPAKTHHKRMSSRRHASAPRAASSSAWVLKAAKPGVAWVARKGSSNLQMVEPGDSLAGIGQIKSIARDSFGRWAVHGTKGRISQ